MDFSRVELSAGDEALQHELRSYLADLVTHEVIRHDRETGENFHEDVHLALGERGYLEKEFRGEADGGFSAVQRRIWELEIGRAHTPWFHWGTSAMVARAVIEDGSPELIEDRVGRAGGSRPPVPGLHRTGGRIRRRDVQDHSGA